MPLFPVGSSVFFCQKMEAICHVFIAKLISSFLMKRISLDMKIVSRVLFKGKKNMGFSL